MSEEDDRRGPGAETEMVVARSQAEVFAFYRDPENLLPALDGSVTIRPISPGRWNWTVRGAAGVALQWTISIAEMIEPERIVYRTEAAEGWVEWRLSFHQADDPGETIVRTSCSTAEGEMALAILSLVGRNPAVETCSSLNRSKQLVEAGGSVDRARPAD